MEDTGQTDICRVCRTEAAADRPLYHPCLCTGSIKYIHQECLVQWLRYSKKDYCELCNHQFSFTPIYAADMPKRLPTRDIVHGLLASVAAALKCWLHYTIVWIAWLLIVPLTAARIYRCLFAMSFSSLLSLPLDILSTENVMHDGLCGFVIVVTTLCFFIAIVWLREQIVHGGAPDWLEPPVAAATPAEQPEEGAAPGDAAVENWAAGIDYEADPPGDPEDFDVVRLMEELHAAVADRDHMRQRLIRRYDLAFRLRVGAQTADGQEPASSENAAQSTGSESDLPAVSGAGDVRQTSHHESTSNHQESPEAVGRVDNVNRTADGFGSNSFNVELQASTSTTSGKGRSALLQPKARSVSASSAQAGPSNRSNGTQHFDSVAPDIVRATSSGTAVELDAADAPNRSTRTVDDVQSENANDRFYGEVKRRGRATPAHLLTSCETNSLEPSRSRSIETTVIGNSGSSGNNDAEPGDQVMEWEDGDSSSRVGIPAADVGNQAEGGEELMNGIDGIAGVIVPVVEDEDQGAGWNAGAAAGGAGDWADRPGAGVPGGPVAGEDITWQRLLGLDGSLVFLEHMFWVLSLNTLFVFVFALVPFHIGDVIASAAGFAGVADRAEFRGPLVTLVGYVVIALFLVTLYTLCQGTTRFRKARRVIGLGYLIIKVSLLAIIELGVFPVVCGGWLNICSMELFGNTLASLQAHVRAAPATNAFLHWLIGMIFIYYFAFFAMLLREVLRPGVLWFLRNLNDPDFHPIQEMIQTSVMLHLRRFIASFVLFGSIILVMVWLPLRIMKKLTPSLIPYNISMQTADMPTTEISMELMILQVVLPALLEQGHTRQFVKWCVRLWCRVVSSLLGIQSYLVGDSSSDDDNAASEENGVPPHQPGAAAEGGAVNQPGESSDGASTDEACANEPPAAAEAHDEDDDEDEDDDIDQPRALAAAHLALGHRQRVLPHQKPYERTSYFPLRIFGLIVCLLLTLTAASTAVLTVPVSVGRWTLGLVMPQSRLHEFYTVGAGLYACWLVIRCVALARSWLPKGWTSIYNSLLATARVGLKTFAACTLLLGLIPLLIGIHFDLIIIIPLRVPLDASPVMYLFHDWALGVLHTKIIGALTLMGPNWWLKTALDQVYRDGMRQMNLVRIVCDIVLPCVAILGLSLTLPYIFVHSVVARFASEATVYLALRRIYPALLFSGLLTWYAMFQWSQFRRLYEHIKNDKYLVGRRLVNYDRHQQEQEQARQETFS